MKPFTFPDPLQGFFNDPRAEAIGIQPEWFGAIGDGDVANMAADTHGWQAAIDLSAASGLPVRPRTATYIIDGHKGDNAVWSGSGLARHGGLVMTPGARVWGSGQGQTILKNGADYWRSVVRIRSGTASMRDLTVDGDIDNHVMVSEGEEDETHGSVRGEGIIFEGSGTVTFFELSNLEVKNTAHYGIGLENVTIKAGLIDTIFFENIGADLIDGKSYNEAGGTHPKSNIYVYNVRTEDGSMHHYPDKYVAGQGYENQSCFDICKGMHYHGIFIRGFKLHGAGQTGTTAVHFRAEVTSSLESGEGASASNIRVYGAKEVDEGEHDVNEPVGIGIATSGVYVSDFLVDNCFTGVNIGAAGDDVPLSCSIHSGVITNCTSAAGIASVGLAAAIGLNIGSGTSSVFATDILVKGCEIGTRIGGTGHHLDLRLEDSLISHVFSSDAGLRQSLARLSFGRANVTPDIGDFDDTASPLHAANQNEFGVSPTSAIFNREITISNDRKSFINLIATADDNVWQDGDEFVGGIRALSADTDGAGAGVRAAIRCVASGSGATYRWEVTAGSTTENDIAVFQFGSTQNVSVNPLRFPESTVALVATAYPAADFRGSVVMLTDGAANKWPVFSNGVAWRYFDGTAV